MLEMLGDRQQELLRALMRKREGLTIDELAETLDITRTAVRQHISALERVGYIERGDLLSTGGRPGQSYRLTAKGYELFPKQYSWFSEVILNAMKAEKGAEGLSQWMRTLGAAVASSLKERVQGKKGPELLEEIASIMNSLAYDAKVVQSADLKPRVEATNCVYHALAKQHPEICQFDISLLEKLSGSKIVHESCIVRGGGTCRFKIDPAKKT